MSVDEASPQSYTEDVAAERGMRADCCSVVARPHSPPFRLRWRSAAPAVGATTSNRDDRGERRAAPAARRSASPPSPERRRRPDGPRGLHRPGPDPVGRSDPARRAGVQVRRHEQRRRPGAAVRHGSRRHDVLPAQSRGRGLLVVNHEAIDSTAGLFPTAPDYTRPETVRKAQNAHGVSICELELRNGAWRLVRSDYARRITANTPMELTGPAAGHPCCRRPPIRPGARCSAR